MSHADTIDARQLAEMRELSAESLATRIRTLQMTYVQDYELDRQPENPTLYALAEIQKKFEDRLAAATDPKQRERLSDAVLQYQSGNSSAIFKLTYAFPAMRTEQKVFRLSEILSPSPPVTPDTVYATDGNSFTSINYLANQARYFLRPSDVASRDVQSVAHDAIGLRSFLVPNLLHGRSLVSLLSHPQITTSLGDESVEGVATVILKVGPGIPVKERPGFLSVTTAMSNYRLHLPSILWRSVQEYHYRNSRRRRKSAVRIRSRPPST